MLLPEERRQIYPYFMMNLKVRIEILGELGEDSDKYGDFLTPLVESCLPEEVLVAWEKAEIIKQNRGSRSLEHLMNFLRQEVKGEEMVLLAWTGLTPQNPRKKDYHATQVNKVETTTAAALVNMDNQDWGEKLNIIERVPDLELNKECHYLAHRPVIKLDSQTTKIRPVF
ncbi:uncharacterized protein TNCV_4645281 [Trichonephila clavipes]|nr:uncharacterized protein TNCV_4645281 [Trichonephila clavipes]